MSEQAERLAFKRQLRQAFGAFRSQEALIRGWRSATPSEETEDNALDALERNTRRFLVDELLKGLDWDPADPALLTEEARSYGPLPQPGKRRRRFYFDYLGLDLETRAPVLLVEAKGFDAELPRGRRADMPSVDEANELIVEALKSLKGEGEVGALIDLWKTWLNDLRDYVLSFTPDEQASLRRVVITAGQWIIVFEDPIGAFLTPYGANVGRIRCFTSFEDILGRADRVFDLLHRSRLIDDLPLTVSLSKALNDVPPGSIDAIFRGVVVATDMVGPANDRYPVRSVTPAVVVMTAGRCVAITDYGGARLEEPLTKPFADFEQDLVERANQFETRVLDRFGLSLSPQPVATLPSLSGRLGRHDRSEPIAPVDGSSAGRRRPMVDDPRPVVFPTGTVDSEVEWLVITGQDWFYKRWTPVGPPCALHDWRTAKAQGVPASLAHVGDQVTSYTKDGVAWHCADEGHRISRASRCRLEDIESHLCCRACVFETLCWAGPPAPRPCPPQPA